MGSSTRDGAYFGPPDPRWSEPGTAWAKTILRLQNTPMGGSDHRPGAFEREVAKLRRTNGG